MIATPRLACILTPNLSIQVERQRRGDNALLIIPHPLNGETVFAASSSLLLAGVEVGMPLHQAKQVAPYATIVEPDEAEYHERHETVREAIKTFSAAIETVRLGEFLIDVRGFGKTYGGEEELAKALTTSVSTASRLAIRVGIATGKFVAQQAARLTFNNTSQVVQEGWEQDFVSPIPIHVLPEIPAEMRRRLELLDIHTLGGLAALNKPAVLRQFGKDAICLRNFARNPDSRSNNSPIERESV